MKEKEIINFTDTLYYIRLNFKLLICNVCLIPLEFELNFAQPFSHLNVQRRLWYKSFIAKVISPSRENQIVISSPSRRQ